MLWRLLHSNHPQCSNTSATAGAKVLILSGIKNCLSTSKNSIDKNFAVRNPRTWPHAYAILFLLKNAAGHAPWNFGSTSCRWFWKTCWNICSMMTLLLPWLCQHWPNRPGQWKSWSMLYHVWGKNNGDDLGFVAGFLKHSPDDFLNASLLVMREMLTSGNVPSSWQTTSSKMLPKTKATKSVSDFQPIANVRLLYKVFAYLMLGTHGGRAWGKSTGRTTWLPAGKTNRKKKLTANVCLQKTLAANTPFWIISLDFSKAFDQVDWNALWTALWPHEISEHLISVLQCAYFRQTAVDREHDTDSCGFNIRGGEVRSGQVRPARHNLASPFRAQAQNASTLHGILYKIRLFYVQQNSMKDLQCWSQTSRFIAASIHRPKPLYLQSDSSFDSQWKCGRPVRCLPTGHHRKIRRIQRSCGRLAMCCANLQ